MKIALIDPLEISLEELENCAAKLKTAGFDFTSYETRTLDHDEIVARAEDADVLIIANLPMPKEVLERLPKLKMISVAFAGVDHLDVDYCTANGIQVCNASGYSTIPVAELTVGMALSALREIVVCDAVTRAETGRAGRVGQDLAGKTVGIVGTGAIGCHAAKLFSAFGCRVIGWSRSEREDFCGEYVAKEELIRTADIVSLHTPLTPETTGLIGKSELEQMKSSAILINCARGPVVDQNALAQAMVKEEIAHAAIDVFDIEPPLAKNHPLLHTPNTTVTPHIAYATREAFSRRADIVVDNILCWQSKHLINAVNEPDHN